MDVSEVIDYLKQHPTTKSIECIVKGFIKSANPLSGIYNKAEKLIYNTVLESYVYTNNP